MGVADPFFSPVSPLSPFFFFFFKYIPHLVCNRYEACTENGELFFRQCDAGTVTSTKKCFTPYPDNKNESSKAWHSACESAFAMQMKHRRDVWWKHTHEKIDVDENAASSTLLISRSETTNLKDVLKNWIKNSSKGTTMYSLEGGMGHGKSEILKHAVAYTIQNNQNVMHAFVDSDPLTTSSGETQGMASIASILYDVFARDGRKTADEIERQCVTILNAAGADFKSLLTWLPCLNPIFPVNFTFRSDDCRSLVMKALKDTENAEMLEMTQRSVLVGLFWALSNAQPLLLVVDDALEMDIKSFNVIEDLLMNGTNIANQYVRILLFCYFF